MRRGGSGFAFEHFLKVTLAFPAAAAEDLTQLSLGIDKHFYYNDLQTWRNLQTISNMLRNKSFDNKLHASYFKYARRNIKNSVSSDGDNLCVVRLFSLQ